MSVLREIFVHLSATADDSQLKTLAGTLNKVLTGVTALGAALGFAKFVEFTNETAAAADELGDMSDRLNISTDALQAWGFAAKLNGSSAEEFNGSIGHLVRSLSEAGSGSDEALKTFKKLGVSVKDSGGQLRSVDSLLPEIADGLKGIANPTERSALALKVFGRGALPLVPLLSKGSEAIAEYAEEFKKLGGGFSETAIKQASDYEDQIDRLNVTLVALKSKALNLLLPVFQRVAEAMTRMGEIFAYITEKTLLLESVLTIIGSRITWLALQWAIANRAILLSTLKTWGIIALKFTAVAAGVLVLVAAVEDVLVLFSGGKSVIGEFIDSIFGIGAAEEAVISIKQGWDELVYSIQNAIHASKEFLGIDAGTAPKSPDQVREERRNAAVASGDVNAFAREHASGRTREQSVEDFKASRAHYLKDHPEAATEKDVSAGLSKKVGADGASATSAVSAQKARAANVNNTSSVVVNLPPGTDKDQAERLRKIIQEEHEKQNRRAVAGLAEESDA
jgi:hypothetical protein